MKKGKHDLSVCTVIICLFRLLVCYLNSLTNAISELASSRSSNAMAAPIPLSCAMRPNMSPPPVTHRTNPKCSKWGNTTGTRAGWVYNHVTSHHVYTVVYSSFPIFSIHLYSMLCYSFSVLCYTIRFYYHGSVAVRACTAVVAFLIPSLSSTTHRVRRTGGGG